MARPKKHTWRVLRSFRFFFLLPASSSTARQLRPRRARPKRPLNTKQASKVTERSRALCQRSQLGSLHAEGCGAICIPACKRLDPIWLRASGRMLLHAPLAVHNLCVQTSNQRESAPRAPRAAGRRSFQHHTGKKTERPKLHLSLFLHSLRVAGRIPSPPLTNHPMRRCEEMSQKSGTQRVSR